MDYYAMKIENLKDFRTNIEGISEAYRIEKTDEEVKLMYLLRKVFDIPFNATIWVEYDLDKEVLTLSSNMKLNIKSKEGFILMRDEELKSSRYDVNGSVLNNDYVYRYHFRM